uniref:Uncharacterized protein n=1 Tax=Wuchereria bancrofti TaxID=6293 RepID=A0AAF5RVB2_WUCBA
MEKHHGLYTYGGALRMIVRMEKHHGLYVWRSITDDCTCGKASRIIHCMHVRICADMYPCDDDTPTDRADILAPYLARQMVKAPMVHLCVVC